MQCLLNIPMTTAAPIVRAVGADSQRRKRPTLLLRGSDDAVVTIDGRALEQYELAEAILNGRDLEVDGEEGLKDVAAVYAICESARAGRTVTMQEVESAAVYAYQAEIDTALGIG